MIATVLSIRRGNLFVLNYSHRQQVQVNTTDAFRFRSGDLVRIRYSGAMTMSIPPQISATSIVLLPQEKIGKQRVVKEIECYLSA